MPDLTFFTNEEGSTLEIRFKEVLKGVQFFDILVGYFRTSGFNRLYNEFKAIGDAKGKIRILVGLNADNLIVKKVNEVKDEWRSGYKIKEEAKKEIKEEMSTAEDSITVDESVDKFKQLIRDGVLEIKAHPSRNIHAKVYISRFKKGDRDTGCVITGSSNFSESGLVEQYEFNVELKNSPDVIYALEQFEKLWKEAVDISQLYIDTVEKETYLSDTITPYEMYLKFLYECYSDKLKLDNEPYYMKYPEGFMKLEYQENAVRTLKGIVDVFGGAFLSDVVGLGKTYIAALYMQNLPGQKLIVCPPPIKENWIDVLTKFEVGGYTVESLGNLDKIIKKGIKQYQYVFVDEAHRFRNADTERYTQLHQICENKKVILITATPQNNSVLDFYPLLKLFLPNTGSKLRVPNLETFFSGIKKDLSAAEKDSPDFMENVKNASKKVRNNILNDIMVRRTRTDIKKFFKNDIKKQGISFPKVETPIKLTYEFDEKTESVFNDTIEILKDKDKKLKLSRYKNNLKKSMKGSEKQNELNLIGLLRTMLIKRLESSRYAFIETIKRFIESYNFFIKMYKEDEIYLEVKMDYDLLEYDEEAFFEKIKQKSDGPYKRKAFKDSLGEDLESDLKLLKHIQTEWKNVPDKKKEAFVKELKSNADLKDKKKKLIIFTESTDTAIDLYNTLEGEYGEKVLMFSSNECRHKSSKGESFSKEIAKQLILDNFDPKNNKDDIRILITTDVLAEGINLHRSNIIVNYDIPWNPTRVMQRIGRVNRVGSKHDKIFIYNIFPTSASDSEIGLTDRIKAKIQAFHDALGEDAKYLTEDEVVSSYKLFKDSYSGNLLDQIDGLSKNGEDEDEFSELKYIKKLEDIRDKEPDLFEKIKNLPLKSRTARGYKLDCNEKLITLFRKGNHNDIYICDGDKTEKLLIEDAIPLFECEKDCKKKNLDKKRFYDLLAKNKEEFEKQCNQDKIEEEKASSKRGANNYVAKRIEGILQDYQENKIALTVDDEQFLQDVFDAYNNGKILPGTSKKINKDIGEETDSNIVIASLKKNIPSIESLENDNNDSQTQETDEDDFSGIILSEMLIKE